MKATPLFAGMRLAAVRSIPTPPRLAVRSEWISSTGSPFRHFSLLYVSPAPEKAGPERPRTAAPSITHGSSAQASKIGRSLGRGLQGPAVRAPAYRVRGDQPDALRRARRDLLARLHEPVADEIRFRRHTPLPRVEHPGDVLLAQPR